MNIKLHLNAAEVSPLERTAEAFGCDVEDIVYSAVNHYMLRLGRLSSHANETGKNAEAELEAARAEVLATKQARNDNLPLWADSACSVHNYEGKGPNYGEKSRLAAY